MVSFQRILNNLFDDTKHTSIATELREQYNAVKPGYHMNKKHWNTIMNHSDMPDQEMREWIKHSYDLVVAKLPKKTKEELAAME